MKKQLSTLFTFVAGLVIAGCATNEPEMVSSSQELPPGPKAQFECADRSGDGFISKSELVYLNQCGVGEDLACGDVPPDYKEQPPADSFDLGLRMLRVMDADNDDQISRLEFRAHCNSAGRAE